MSEHPLERGEAHGEKHNGHAISILVTEQSDLELGELVPILAETLHSLALAHQGRPTAPCSWAAYGLDVGSAWLDGGREAFEAHIRSGLTSQLSIDQALTDWDRKRRPIAIVHVQRIAGGAPRRRRRVPPRFDSHPLWSRN